MPTPGRHPIPLPFDPHETRRLATARRWVFSFLPPAAPQPSPPRRIGTRRNNLSLAVAKRKRPTSRPGVDPASFTRGVMPPGPIRAYRRAADVPSGETNHVFSPSNAPSSGIVPAVESATATRVRALKTWSWKLASFG